MNMERIIDKLEKRGYQGISSATEIKISYVTKGNELTILTPSCGSLNLNIHNWESLKNEVQSIIDNIRGI